MNRLLSPSFTVTASLNLFNSLLRRKVARKNYNGPWTLVLAEGQKRLNKHSLAEFFNSTGRKIIMLNCRNRQRDFSANLRRSSRFIEYSSNCRLEGCSQVAHVRKYIANNCVLLSRTSPVIEFGALILLKIFWISTNGWQSHFHICSTLAP